MKLYIGLNYRKRASGGLLYDLDRQILPIFRQIVIPIAKKHNATLIFGHDSEWTVNRHSLWPVHGAQYKLKDEKSLNAMLSEIKSEWRKLKSNSKKRHLTNLLRLSFGIVK